MLEKREGAELRELSTLILCCTLEFKNMKDIKSSCLEETLWKWLRSHVCHDNYFISLLVLFYCIRRASLRLKVCTFKSFPLNGVFFFPPLLNIRRKYFEKKVIRENETGSTRDHTKFWSTLPCQIRIPWYSSQENARYQLDFFFNRILNKILYLTVSKLSSEGSISNEWSRLWLEQIDELYFNLSLSTAADEFLAPTLNVGAKNSSAAVLRERRKRNNGRARTQRMRSRMFSSA